MTAKALSALAVLASPLLALALPSLALAQDAPGGAVCDQQIQDTRQYIEQNRNTLSEQARRDAERRLNVARGECSSAPVLGEAHLSNLQVGIGMTDTQTARLPSVEVDELPAEVQ